MVDAETYDHVGFVDTKTLRNDLGMTQSQLYTFLEQGKTYKNCYLVEDEELDRLEENFDISTMFRVTNSQNQELRWSGVRPADFGRVYTVQKWKIGQNIPFRTTSCKRIICKSYNTVRLRYSKTKKTVVRLGFEVLG